MKKLTVSGLIDLLSTFNGNMEIKVFENVIRGDGWGKRKQRTIILVKENEKDVELWIESRDE